MKSVITVVSARYYAAEISEDDSDNVYYILGTTHRSLPGDSSTTTRQPTRAHDTFLGIITTCVVSLKIRKGGDYFGGRRVGGN
jgi:hypothetical protein